MGALSDSRGYRCGVGLAVAVATMVRFDEVLATAQAGAPGAARDSLAHAVTTRVTVAGLLAVVWPLLLCRLAHGAARGCARTGQGLVLT
jgi:hypothetical protein